MKFNCKAILIAILGMLLMIFSVAGISVAGVGKIIPNTELISGEWSQKPVENSAFAPGPDAGKAKHQFNGILKLENGILISEPPIQTKNPLVKEDATIFPGLPISFITAGQYLVPLDRGVIRNAFDNRTGSFWELVVQPGRVWTEPSDKGWSRAAFPFSLVASLDGETRIGLATFVYNDKDVSQVRYQIVQQTSPYMMYEYFTAWGQVKASYKQGIENAENVRKAFEVELKNRIPMAPYSNLEAKIGANKIAGINGDMDLDYLLGGGVYVDGVFYYQTPTTPYGPYPYPQEMRFGVWSISKSMITAVAMLRLAEKFGPEVFEARLLDYFTSSENNAPHKGWDKVKFKHCLDMTTGLGNGSDKRDPNDTYDGYWKQPDANKWYYAYRDHEKLKYVFTSGNLPWGPGEVVRYNDQDMWILGVAMDRFLKKKAGKDASIYKMLQEEVYGSIGINHLPMTTAYTDEGSPGSPHYAWGALPTIDDMIKVAKLIMNKGKHGSKQILNAEMCEKLLAAGKEYAKPVGYYKNRYGEFTYAMGHYYASYKDADGNKFMVPHMKGYGGGAVVMMPNGVVAIRLGKNPGADFASEDVTSCVVVGNRIKAFAPPKK